MVAGKKVNLHWDTTRLPERCSNRYKGSKTKRGFIIQNLQGEENNVMTISSYVVKTSKGIKNVLILSTHGPILGITKDYG